jgi:hypothetical protein
MVYFNPAQQYVTERVDLTKTIRHRSGGERIRLEGQSIHHELGICVRQPVFPLDQRPNPATLRHQGLSKAHQHRRLVERRHGRALRA